MTIAGLTPINVKPQEAAAAGGPTLPVTPWAHYDFTDRATMTFSGDRILTVTDKSANGYDLIEKEADPVFFGPDSINTSGWNSHYYANFDASNFESLLSSSTSLTLGQSFTVLGVFGLPATLVNGAFVRGSNTGTYAAFRSGGQLRLHAPTNVGPSGAATGGDFWLGFFIFAGSTSKIYWKRDSVGPFNAASATSLDPGTNGLLSSGQLQISDSANSFDFDGKMYEIAIFDSELSLAQMNEICNDYLEHADRYNFSSSDWS